MTIARSALALVAALALNLTAHAEEEIFSNPVVDIGIVVKDIEKSTKFYGEVLGLQKVGAFEVSAQMATDFGLTDNQPASVQVYALSKKEGATKLKLMSFPNAQGKSSDQKFIHSTLGFSYLTLFVTDMDAAMERLKKAGVKTLGKTPGSLGGKNKLTVVRDPDGNFVELIGPSEK